MIVNDKISNEILLLNIYNEKAQNAEKKQSYMIEWELAKIRLNDNQKVIITEDFNAHHSWWNTKIANLIRTKVYQALSSFEWIYIICVWANSMISDDLQS